MTHDFNRLYIFTTGGLWDVIDFLCYSLNIEFVDFFKPYEVSGIILCWSNIFSETLALWEKVLFIGLVYVLLIYSAGNLTLYIPFYIIRGAIS